MNSLYIVAAALFAFFWAYRWYARKLETLFSVDPHRSTPAFSKYDSVDYVPARNRLVLFGHHFASIAGAGPIIGPVYAVLLWGWLPALLWVVVGTVFIGGVHDFGSLMASVREGGSSIAEIAQHAVSRRAKILFSLFVWLALILVIAVFARLCAATFVNEPKVVLPSLGLIPVAMAVGYFLYSLRLNTALATAFGLLCLAGLIYAGNLLPVTGGITLWLVILFAYSYLASILPVNILLQPRDYLSSFLLFFGVGIGYLGLLVSRPAIHMPPLYRWQSSEGYLWPALFVTVACGAVSGFHALIASGTSSKQIANERHAKFVGYGGMIAEGFVAVLAIISVAALIQKGSDTGSMFSGMSPIDIFARGYGAVSERFLGGYGSFIAVTILNAFILTTLDTATRIARYLSEELFRIKNRYASTALIVALSGTLALSGRENMIWPIFGASNQLVAALSLLVLSCWLIARKKSALITLWGACFMLVTTVCALTLQAVTYVRRKDITLSAVAVILIILSGFMVFEVVPVLSARRKQNA